MMRVQLDLSPFGHESKVHLDGIDVAAAVRALTVEGRAGYPTTMTLALNLPEVTPVDGDMEILIPDVTRELLVQLGWVPPEEA